jgi:glycosyltransferase involved in cell wall biosynthesis
MRASVFLEQRFCRLPDRSVWTQSGFHRSFWERYLAVFDRVRCVARVQDVPRLTGDWHRTDGRDVSVCTVPHYIGLSQFLAQFGHVRYAIHSAVRPGDAFLLRVPGAIGDIAWSRLRGLGYPFAVEVLGDPHDVFAPGAVRHPLRPVLRWHTTRQLTRQCLQACAASYVTERALQQRYVPAGPAISASCIELREDAFAAAPRVFRPTLRPVQLVFVGSLEQYYKAPDVMIRSMAIGMAGGLDCRLTIVGEGRLRPTLEAFARTQRCADRIRFIGHLPDPARVRAELDAADLFVLPSRTEGLPRAMIEAMARGLPCIGSRVGGIPELLQPEAMVAPDDAVALSDRIRDFVSDPAVMNRCAAANFERARAYRHEVLQERRTLFYRFVRDRTNAWLQAHAGDETPDVLMQVEEARR